MRAKERAALEVLLQIGLVTAMGAYLWQRRVDLKQQNQASGDDLLARLMSEMGTQSLVEGALWLDRQSHEQKAGHRKDWRAWWALYRHAGLLLRLADKATVKGAEIPVDPATILWLRRNAMQARMAALTGLAGCAFQG